MSVLIREIDIVRKIYGKRAVERVIELRNVVALVVDVAVPIFLFELVYFLLSFFL